MCIKRRAGNCTRTSFVTYQGSEYWVDVTDELAWQEEVSLVAVDGSGAEIVGFSVEVESHYLSPVERRALDKMPSCYKGLYNR